MLVYKKVLEDKSNYRVIHYNSVMDTRGWEQTTFWFFYPHILTRKTEAPGRDETQKSREAINVYQALAYQRKQQASPQSLLRTEKYMQCLFFYFPSKLNIHDSGPLT